MRSRKFGKRTMLKRKKKLPLFNTADFKDAGLQGPQQLQRATRGANLLDNGAMQVRPRRAHPGLRLRLQRRPESRSRVIGTVTLDWRWAAATTGACVIQTTGADARMERQSLMREKDRRETREDRFQDYDRVAARTRFLAGHQKFWKEQKLFLLSRHYYNFQKKYSLCFINTTIYMHNNNILCY